MQHYQQPRTALGPGTMTRPVQAPGPGTMPRPSVPGPGTVPRPSAPGPGTFPKPVQGPAPGMRDPAAQERFLREIQRSPSRSE